MTRQSLDGAWLLAQAGNDESPAGEWLPATVPGGVHTDLMAAGRISDPFVGDEELRVQWVAELDWVYRREFEVDAAVLAEERIALVCDGLDTLAGVRLNGEWLGSADNMFRTWRWDVTGRLRSGPNELAVTFRSAVVRARELETTRHLDSPADQLPGAPYLRKAPCHFGWDWGPKLPNVGFWQGVALEGWSEARIADARISQSVELGAAVAGSVPTAVRARIEARLRVERTAASPTRPIEAILEVSHPNGRIQAVRSILAGPGAPAPADGAGSAAGPSEVELSVEVVEPELWWPNGLGAQPLYRVEVRLADAERMLDGRSFEVGLRTLELRREPDQWGESFGFVVNSVAVFARGANWIPADSFPARVGPQQLEALLGAAAAANHNMVRVWGGGYFETEAFYDLCDRLGLLVWQDFMFSCSVYPLDDAAFLDNVRVEVAEQVARLRHRACLALWCGNNEMERGWTIWGWTRPDTADLREAYLEFFVRTLPAWIAAGDGATPYWPSSPSSGKPLEAPIGDRAGDEHEWIVWHALAPFSSYQREVWRFVSEFGFESLPAEATVAAFAPDPADWNLGSAMLDHHQRCPTGNARILYYLGQQFRVPRDFGGLVYLSQVLQAEAMRVGVEHWRRERDRCSGTLYWQINDCWPVSSWSSIDYFGRWKALHYVSRRFYEPVLLSCAVGEPAAGDVAGAAGGRASGAAAEVELSVTNDRPTEWRGDVRWSLERLDGEPVSAGSWPVLARGTATTPIGRVPVPRSLEERRSTVLVAELLEEGRRRALTVTTFVPDKHLALSLPKIEVSMEAVDDGAPAEAAGREAELAVARARVRLRSDTLARWVELSLDCADVVFGDNYFDLTAGRDATVEFDLPEGWDVDRARAALRVRSVADTYV